MLANGVPPATDIVADAPEHMLVDPAIVAVGSEYGEVETAPVIFPLQPVAV